MPQKSLSGAALYRMHGVCLGVAQNMGFELLELNGEADNFAGGGGRAAAGRVTAAALGLDAGRPPQGRQQSDAAQGVP
jgi:hypothetical protein